MLLFVTDWELLFLSVVGGSAISASVFGLLIYGAYKVCTWKFGPGVFIHFSHSFVLDILEFFNLGIHCVLSAWRVGPGQNP